MAKTYTKKQLQNAIQAMHAAQEQLLAVHEIVLAMAEATREKADNGSERWLESDAGIACEELAGTLEDMASSLEMAADDVSTFADTLTDLSDD